MSLRQVYDVLSSYFVNVEINLSERLDHITVREDYVCNDVAHAANYRLVSVPREGDPRVEKNCILFSQFFEAGEFPTTKGEACAIIALDDVNDDVLHPYHSHERIRKDITVAIVLTSHLRPTPAGNALVVTMARAGDLKLYYPQFEVDMEILQGLREHITG